MISFFCALIFQGVIVYQVDMPKSLSVFNYLPFEMSGKKFGELSDQFNVVIQHDSEYGSILFRKPLSLNLPDHESKSDYFEGILFLDKIDTKKMRQYFPEEVGISYGMMETEPTKNKLVVIRILNEALVNIDNPKKEAILKVAKDILFSNQKLEKELLISAKERKDYITLFSVLHNDIMKISFKVKTKN